jgi:hypothetical protein
LDTNNSTATQQFQDMVNGANITAAEIRRETCFAGMFSRFSRSRGYIPTQNYLFPCDSKLSEGMFLFPTMITGMWAIFSTCFQNISGLLITFPQSAQKDRLSSVSPPLIPGCVVHLTFLPNELRDAYYVLRIYSEHSKESPLSCPKSPNAEYACLNFQVDPGCGRHHPVCLQFWTAERPLNVVFLHFFPSLRRLQCVVDAIIRVYLDFGIFTSTHLLVLGS